MIQHFLSSHLTVLQNNKRPIATGAFVLFNTFVEDCNGYTYYYSPSQNILEIQERSHRIYFLLRMNKARSQRFIYRNIQKSEQEEKMILFYLSITLAAICVITFITTTMIMVSRLQSRGEKINYLFIKLYFPKYVHQYNRFIREETGKSSPVYLIWLITINGAWIFSILALLLK